MKKLSFFNRIILSINTIFAIILFCSYFTPYIKPSSIKIIPLLSLLVPVLIVANLVFVAYWVLLGFKRPFIMSLFVLIVGLLTAPSLYKFTTKSSSTDDGLTIMTFNVRKFNKYKWIKSENIDAEISEFIHRERPDILALQEYQNSDNFKLEYPYYSNPPNNNYSDSLRNQQHRSNLAIFSKYPIINEGIIKYNLTKHIIMYADIVRNSDTIRVYNFHLASLGVVPDQDYFGHSDSKKLIKRLGNAFSTHEKQVYSFIDHIAKCSYKTIIIGDMNNTAYSWAYKHTKNNLKDTFIEAGQGFGKTYSFKGFPLRIDYIFVDKSIKIHEHKNYSVKYSDHFPVKATLSF